MDLIKHYESYRTSVLKDAPEGYAEISKNEYISGFKIYDYLKTCVSNIYKFAENDDSKQYSAWLIKHQEATKFLFEAVVSRAIRSKDKPKEIAILDLAQDRGMNWLKFSKFTLEFDKLIIIPRFDDKFNFKSYTLPVFDADELGIILGSRSKSLSSKAMRRKLDYQSTENYHKIVAWAPSGFEWHPIKEINKNVVLDWTLQIWSTHEERKPGQLKTFKGDKEGTRRLLH